MQGSGSELNISMVDMQGHACVSFSVHGEEYRNKLSARYSFWIGCKFCPMYSHIHWGRKTVIAAMSARSARNFFQAGIDLPDITSYYLTPLK